MEEKNSPKPETREVPAASLSGLVLSLSAAALAYMGKPVTPGAAQPETNLPLAKHTIDTIAMLQAKTEGNRTEEETKVLDGLLYQLRLTYVKMEEESGKQKTTASPEPKEAPAEPAKPTPEKKEDKETSQ